jgi:hypothetical protein
MVYLYPPDSKLYGLSYSEWSAVWWKWLLSIPSDINPSYDGSEKSSDQNQSGPVWFLPGRGIEEKHSKHIYTVTVPTEKSLLFPLSTSIHTSTNTSHDISDSELKQRAKSDVDSVTELRMEIDGYLTAEKMREYRTQSPTFDLKLPENNILGIRGSENVRAVSDGYWILMKAPPEGKHIIHCSSTFDRTGTESIYNVTARKLEGVEEAKKAVSYTVQPIIRSGFTITGHQAKVKDDDIGIIEEIVKDAVPTLRNESIIHDKGIDNSKINSNVEELFITANKYMEENRRNELKPWDLTMAFLDMGSKGSSWPFCG